MFGEYERRYPPSPYGPRTEATRLYRDGWDQGWQHVGKLGRAWALDYYRRLGGGPYAHGYRDGARARVRRLLVEAERDRRYAAEDAAVARAERRASAADEQPY